MTVMGWVLFLREGPLAHAPERPYPAGELARGGDVGDGGALVQIGDEVASSLCKALHAGCRVI